MQIIDIILIIYLFFPGEPTQVIKTNIVSSVSGCYLVARHWNMYVRDSLREMYYTARCGVWDGEKVTLIESNNTDYWMNRTRERN